MTADRLSVGEVAATVARCRRDEIVVSTMSGMALAGEPAEHDFRVLGVMGTAASIGLGLALGQSERPVWVVDGDGSLLMQLGVLSAIGGGAPPGLTHLVVANGVYAVSGAQPLPTEVDWPGLARAAGYVEAGWVDSPDELQAALRAGRSGPRLIAARCAPDRPAYPPGAFDFDATDQARNLRRTLSAGRRP